MNYRTASATTNVSPIPDPNLSKTNAKADVMELVQRRGRPSTGLYPDVSRAELAELTGYHISSVAGILQGRSRVSLRGAVVMAQAVGVTVQQLSEDLAKQQKRYKKQQKKKNPRKK